LSFVNAIFPDDPIVTLVFSVAAVVLLAWTSILILRGKIRLRLSLRLVLNATSVVCLFLLILRPHRQAQFETSEAILITKGAKLDRIQTFADTAKAQRAVFSTDVSINWTSRFPGAEEIPDLAFMKRNHPKVGVVHVFGSGLPQYEWASHRSLKVFQHGPGRREGITSVSWSKKLRLGQSLQVNGTLSGINGKQVVLRLVGPGGVADSIAVDPTSEKSFHLQTTPRDTGRFVYTIDFITSGKKYLNEPAAVSVVPHRPVRLLVLQSAPSFHSKYLKRWLAENGAALAFRSQISQDRYRSEFLNMSEMALAPLSRRLLKRFDLLVIDGKTLSKLTSRERTILQNAVAEDGLGAFLVADQALVAGGDQTRHSPFPTMRFTEFTDLEYRLVKLKFGSLRDRETTPIRVAPFEIQYEPGLKPLIKDDTGRILAAAFQSGRGRVGTSLIQNAYQWVLEDRADYYAAYWSDLISELARPANSEPVWKPAQDRLAFIDRPVELQLSAIEAQQGVVFTPNGEVRRLYPRQDVLFPARWSATFWPRESGWHKAASPAGAARWFYVYGSEEWSVWQANDRRRATRRMANSAISTSDSAPSRETTQAVPLFWIFGLLVISTSLLWIEKKL
jgi:hypothetical protein